MNRYTPPDDIMRDEFDENEPEMPVDPCYAAFSKGDRVMADGRPGTLVRICGDCFFVRPNNQKDVEEYDSSEVTKL